MSDTLTLALVGALAYTVVAMAAQRLGYLPSFLHVSGPFVTIHTERGKALLDRLARHRRFWRAVTNVGLGFSLLVMVGAFASVLLSGIMTVQRPETNPIRGPTDALVLPGINEFLPLAAAPEIVFGLLVAMVVHEGGHGLLCRVEGIDIDSMGVGLFTIVPIGAFVEPDEESQRAADRGARTRMFVAGVTNNFVVTILAVLLLFGPVAGSITAVDGYAIGGVDPGSPADRIGIESGDVLTAVNASHVTIRERGTVAVESWVYVHQAADDAPLDLRVNDTIVAVNDTPIAWESDLLAAIENRTVATLRTRNGHETTAPIGAYGSRVTPDGPLASAGAPAGASIVITHFDDERIANASSLYRSLDGATPGETVAVRGYVNGSRQRYTVTLGSRGDPARASLGVADVKGGYSGIGTSELGVRAYPAERMLALLGGDTDAGMGLNVLQHALYLMILPFQALIVPNTFGFAGFLGSITNFYTIGGPLGFLGGGVFVLANLLFWTIWVNLNLAVFNLIPVFPLDGGHILRTSTEGIVARTPLSKRWVVRAVTVSVGLAMFAGLMLMLFGPLVIS